MKQIWLVLLIIATVTTVFSQQPKIVSKDVAAYYTANDLKEGVVSINGMAGTVTRIPETPSVRPGYELAIGGETFVLFIGTHVSPRTGQTSDEFMVRRLDSSEVPPSKKKQHP